MKAHDKVSLLSSIKTKIIVLVILAIIGTNALNLWTVIPLIQNNMGSTIQSYMEDITILAGENLDREVEEHGEAALTAEGLSDDVGAVTVKDMASSYAYVVAQDGTMLYHPTPEKIGKPVENAVVSGLIEEMKKGNFPEPDIIEYSFKDTEKYASYYIGKDTHYILVVTADVDEVFHDLNIIIDKCVKGGIFALIVCGIIGFIIAILIVKPITKTTLVVRKISDLDFKKDSRQETIIKRKDETGLMGRSIEHLRKELTGAIQTIKGQSARLYDTSTTLNTSATETSVSVDQVEKAISEIAQGASSQAQETQIATENVILMGSMIEETNEEVENLRNNARIMRDAGDTALQIIQELDEINKKTRDAIQVIYNQTNTTNDSALKIKAATNIITDIAEETNLLSLNASIEAARAGEQGRGFAVVAGQIQKLADQSNESARQIEEIINMLIAESQKSVETMEEVKLVIEKQSENVIQTEQAFRNVKTGIDGSIDGIRTIAAKTTKLDEARIKVVDVVQNLTAIAEENAASSEETSASAAEVGAIMTTIAENANQLNQIAIELEESIKQFIIE